MKNRFFDIFLILGLILFLLVIPRAKSEEKKEVPCPAGRYCSSVNKADEPVGNPKQLSNYGGSGGFRSDIICLRNEENTGDYCSSISFVRQCIKEHEEAKTVKTILYLRTMENYQLDLALRDLISAVDPKTLSEELQRNTVERVRRAVELEQQVQELEKGEGKFDGVGNEGDKK